MRRMSLALACLLPLAAVACDSATAPRIESTRFAAHLEVDLAAMQRTPSGVYFRDRVTGDGPRVQAGQRLSVHYRGWLATGEMFDQRQPPQTPFQFTLGARQVIRGWEEGLQGMNVGSRRQLVIPPELGYGRSGSGPIPPNAILVFEVTLVAAE
jgi:FKBP-type peptidyl-prolyl cis-trans isomerase FkpA